LKTWSDCSHIQLVHFVVTILSLGMYDLFAEPCILICGVLCGCGSVGGWAHTRTRTYVYTLSRKNIWNNRIFFCCWSL